MIPKPEGKFKCRVCGMIWEGSRLYQDERAIAVVWTCGNLSCGGVCDLILDEIRIAQTRFQNAHTALMRTFNPTQEIWDEFEAARKFLISLVVHVF